MKRHYTYEDCEYCGSDYCSKCRERYVAQLEQIVSDCVTLVDVMAGGYPETLMEHVSKRVMEREEEQS